SGWDLGGGSTVYLKYKDAKGNESASVSATLPSNIPQSVVITDLSNPSTGDCKNSLGWTAISTISSYSVDRSTDNSNWTLEYATVSDINKPGFIDYGLDSGTTYYYRVHSRDSSSNASFASSAVSKKPCQNDNVAPTISSVSVKSTASNSATITWTTDEKADSYVEYGTANTYGTISGKNESETSHEISLPASLSSSTTYHFRARSRDAASNLAVSGDNTFTTATATSVDPTATPADISSVSVSDVTLTSAILTWETSAVATSVVDIGASTAYGTRVEDKSLSSTTKHTVKFSDLKDSTTYHFRISGADATGKKLASDDYTFSTLTLPVVSSVSVSGLGAREATLVWETNTPTDTFVEYTPTSGESAEKGKSESTKKHSFTLENLNPRTSYTYRVKSRDGFGNQAASGYLTFTTIIDTTPPKISDVKSETSLLGEEQGKVKVQAIISWVTDEPATAQVQYSLGVTGKDEYQQSNKEDISLSLSHIMVLQELLPSATYHFRAISKDSSGNITSSSDYSILTTRKSKSLLTTIVEVLEDTFSWVKLIKLR
ncbi:fibronectin type III domain-containing protein, partial [Candidatus Berkelbacteria bacterium]|nr:fibronectin type III domain-containing protein [Candidatus Berkelbacteria bacterium]